MGQWDQALPAAPSGVSGRMFRSAGSSKHNLFQIADVDTGVIRWVNADLVTHVIRDC